MVELPDPRLLKLMRERDDARAEITRLERSNRALRLGLNRLRQKARQQAVADAAAASQRQVPPRV